MNSIYNLGIHNRFRFFSAVFRLFICFHLLKDLYYSWSFIPLLYTNSSFLNSGPTFILEMIGVNSNLIRSNFNLFIGLYILIIILYSLGIGRYITAFLLFVLYDILQRLCPVVLNGGDNLLRYCVLYMVF